MPATCPHCSAALPAVSDAFCPGCGRELAGSAIASGVEAPPVSAPPPDPLAVSAFPAPSPEAMALPNRLAEFQRTLAGLTPHVYMTTVLAAITALVFILMTVSSANLNDPTAPELLRWGANFGPRTANGEWWRLLTCIFVHIGIVHFLLNMWVLAVAGPLVERMVGNVGFLLLYLVAGLCGSLASLLWNPLLVSAGASGALFGLFGALLALLLREHGSIPPTALTQLRNSGLGFLAYNLIFGMMSPNIDNAAHVGGLVGGFLCGLVLAQPFTPEARAGRPARNLSAGALGALVVLAGVMGISVRDADLSALEGAKAQHGNLEVIYNESVPKAEADRLAAYLDQSWGQPRDRRSVHLKKTAEGYQLRLAVKKEFRNNQKMLEMLAFDGAKVSRDVFDGAPVEVHACDEYFRTVQVIPPRPDMRFGVV